MQKRAVESDSGRGGLRSSRGKGQVGERRGVVNCGRLELTRVSACAACSRDGDEHAAIVLRVLLSQEDEGFPATKTTTKGEEKDRKQAHWVSKERIEVRCW